MPENRPRLLFIFLAFVLLTIIAWWQIAFLQNSLKWDMLDCYLPWRYQVGECLQNGVFPFWNPYTHFGYPIHADLRSVWYPETFIVGLTTGYSYLTIHLLFVLHLSLAGLGMYLLSSHFVSNWRASFMAGAAYLMSGFFVGHGQEMFGIIAATWIPFVLYYFIRLQQDIRLKDVPLIVIFSFLLVTGGYQALWAILIYLLVAIFIVYFIRYFIQKQTAKAWRLLWLNALMAVLTALSLSVIAVSFFQVAPHIGRLGGLSLEEAWFMPFAPRSAISFLLPFATVKDPEWYATDISMNNAYVGLIVLVFCILSLFKKQKLLFYLLMSFGLVCLLAGFGEFTPVREVLYRYLPLLNLFRHSSFFSYFTVLAFITGGAVGLDMFLGDSDRYRWPLIGIGILAGLIIAGLWASVMKEVNLNSFTFFKAGFSMQERLAMASRQEHIVLHAMIQLVVLTVFLFMMRRRRPKTGSMLAGLIIVEMLIAVQMNMYFTVASDVDPIELSADVQRQPRGFPLPQQGSTIAMNSDRNTGFSVLWRNASIFTKTVSAEGYNSFRLNNYDYLMDSLPNLSWAVQQNAVMYLSGEIYPFSVKDTVNFDERRDVLFVEDSVYRQSFAMLKKSQTDSLNILTFYPGYARARVQCEAPVAITLLQSVYPGWSARVNGKPAEILVSNQMFISLILSPGTHEVEFMYRNKLVMAAFVVSYGVLLALLSLLLWFSLPLLHGRVRFMLIALMWLLVGGMFLVRFSCSYECRQQQAYQKAANSIVKHDLKLLLLNVDDSFGMKQALSVAGFKGDAYYANVGYDYGLSRWISLADSLDATRAGILNLCAVQRPEAMAAIHRHWPVFTTGARLRYGELRVYTTGKPTAGFSSLNDFEAGYAGWSGNQGSLTEATSFSGKFSNKIDSLHPGSFTYKWEVPKANEGHAFEIYATAQVRGNFEGSALIISLWRDNKAILTSSTGSRTTKIGFEKWTAVAKSMNFPKGAQAGDEIRVFFWAGKQAEFYIDDFYVEMSRAD